MMNDKIQKGHEAGYQKPLLIFELLIVLTVITVTVSTLGLPPAAGIIAAMLIAGAKASLVIVYFMHLKNESVVLRLLVLFVLVTLAAILILTFSDYSFREAVKL